MLTAISLIPVLNPDATTVASHQATSVPPNIVDLLAGHAYPVSGLGRQAKARSNLCT